jgi:hypothetical protein
MWIARYFVASFVIFILLTNSALADERKVQAYPGIFVAGNVAYEDFLSILAEESRGDEDRLDEDGYDFFCPVQVYNHRSGAYR